MKDMGKITLVAGIILVFCLVSAGCTSSYNSQKVYTETSTAVQETGSAATQAATSAPAAKSEIENIKDGLDGIAASWLVSEVKCSGNTCTADLSNDNGNTANIQVFIHSSISTAEDRFDNAKNEYKGFNMETPYIPQADDAFIWSEKNDSTGGVIKGNIVAIIEVSVPGDVAIYGKQSGVTGADELLEQVAAVI